MGDLEIYGNDECDSMKINISEEDVLDQVEKTKLMKLEESRSVQKQLNFRTVTGKSLQCDFEKQGCFPRLKNFPVPKDESEMNVGNADPRAEDAHSVQPWMRLIWACRLRPAGLQLSPPSNLQKAPVN